METEVTLEESVNLFAAEAKELREARMLADANRVISAGDRDGVAILVHFVEHYAGHLATGLQAAGFPEDEATLHGWQVAWRELKSVVSAQTGYVDVMACTVERNLSHIFGPIESAQDFPPARTFYQTFVGHLTGSGVYQTEAWIFDPI